MKIACATALAHLARTDVPDCVKRIHGRDDLAFGRDYIIPSPFDPRLLSEVASAVMQAAIDSGASEAKISPTRYAPGYSEA